MRIRQNKPQPLFRQEFSDWMASQTHRWTENVQDSYLSWITAPMYKSLLNGELCAEPYDPYIALLNAIKIDKDVEKVRQILHTVSEILSNEISDTAINSAHYENVTNWQSAWEAYSEFIMDEIIPGYFGKETDAVEDSSMRDFFDYVLNPNSIPLGLVSEKEYQRRKALHKGGEVDRRSKEEAYVDEFLSELHEENDYCESILRNLEKKSL